MNKTQLALLERHKDKHLLLFIRSMEKSRTDGELFDILESIPQYPVVWDENLRKWITTDLLQGKDKSIESK